MIPLQMAGPPVSVAPQDVPTGSGVVGDAADFLSLFKRAIAAGGETETSAAAPEAAMTDVIGLPTAGERHVAPQPSPDAGGKQDRVEQTVDAVIAALMAAWSAHPESVVPDRPSGLAPTLDHVGDVQPSDVISRPAAAGSSEASVTPGLIPTPVRTPESGVDPVANLATATQSAVSTTSRAVDKDLRVTPSVVSQSAAAVTITTATTPPAAEPRVATAPDATLMRLSAGEEPHVGVEMTTDPQARGDSNVRDMVKQETMASVVPAGDVRTDHGGGKAVRAENPHVVEQPSTAVRDAQDVVPTDQSETRSDVARVDTAYTGAAASALVEVEPRSAPSVVSQSAAAVTITTATTPPAAEPRVATPPDVTSMRLSAGEEPRVVVEMTTDPQARGNSSLSPRLMSLSAAQMQQGHDAVSRSNDESAEPHSSLPSILTPVDGSAMVTATQSKEATGDSPFPQRRLPRIARPSEAVEAMGLEAAETDGVPERRETIHDGDRVTAARRSSRFEATDEMRQGRSSAASDTDTTPPDRPSSSSSDGRPLGSDALVGAPKGEAIRSESASPPAHPRALVDQVVDQIAMAARLSSRRNETERVQLRLHPQALGELVIEVSWKESGIVAAIKAQSHITGELLAGDLGRLKTALGEQGITVSGLAVQVGVDLREWRYGGQTPQFPARIAVSHPLSADRVTPIADSRAWEPDSLIDIRV